MKESLHFAGLPRRIPAQCNSADAGAVEDVDVSNLTVAVLAAAGCLGDAPVHGQVLQL
jgi:hypothetical protein